MIEFKEKFLPWFEECSDSLAKNMHGNYVELDYKKGEMLCKQGAFADQIIFIDSGLCKVYKENGDKSLIIRFSDAGNFLGLSSLYNESIFHYSASCIVDCKVYALNASVIKKLIKEDYYEK